MLAEVRSELQPWERQLIEHQGKLEVACTERKLLVEKVIFFFGRGLGWGECLAFVLSDGMSIFSHY